MNKLKIGDFYWEYVDGVGYKCEVRANYHIKFFWKDYGTRTFFTKEELLAVYPNAVF